MPVTVKSLKKKADATFSKYVRYRDGEYRNGQWVVDCITCGVIKPISQMQNGHFVTRRASMLRFDEENCNAQCVGCNMFKAGEQYLYSKAIDTKYGSGKAEELMSRRHETHKFTIEELEEIIRDAQEQINWYEKYKT